MEVETPDQFDEFMPLREAASNDYIRGDAQGLAAMLTEKDPATHYRGLSPKKRPLEAHPPAGGHPTAPKD